MKTTTQTLVTALRALSADIQSEDGVANSVVMEAADRITHLSRIIADFQMELDEDLELIKSSTDKMSHAVITINALREHIQILIVAGNDMAQLLCLGKSKVPGCVARWNNAKEVHK
jgi:hypothetical protein